MISTQAYDVIAFYCWSLAWYREVSAFFCFCFFFTFENHWHRQTIHTLSHPWAVGRHQWTYLTYIHTYIHVFHLIWFIVFPQFVIVRTLYERLTAASSARVATKLWRCRTLEGSLSTGSSFLMMLLSMHRSVLHKHTNAYTCTLSIIVTWCLFKHLCVLALMLSGHGAL